MVVRTAVFAGIFVPVSQWSQSRKLLVLRIVQKVKIIPVRIRAPYLGNLNPREWRSRTHEVVTLLKGRSEPKTTRKTSAKPVRRTARSKNPSKNRNESWFQAYFQNCSKTRPANDTQSTGGTFPEAPVYTICAADSGIEPAKLKESLRLYQRGIEYPRRLALFQGCQVMPKFSRK
jgi:hypothetical protein